FSVFIVNPVSYQVVIGSASTSTGDNLIGGSSSDFILGRIGSDLLDGSSGGDFLDGGAGDDTIKGGGGNDRIDGGTGTNTAWFELARNQYDISVQGSSVVVKALGAQGFEGVDTLTNIQLFRFLDGTYTLSQLQQPGDTVRPLLLSTLP